MLVVRRARAEDAGAITALTDDVLANHHAALPWRFKAPAVDTLPFSQSAKLTAATGIVFFLAELDGTASGYALAELQRRPETSRTHAYDPAYVHHITVNPGLRLRGIGRALLDAVSDLARSEGIDRVARDT